MASPCKNLSVLLLIPFMMMILSGCGSDHDEMNVNIRVKVKSNKGEIIFLERISIDGTSFIDSSKVNNQGEAVFNLITNDFEFLLISDGSMDQIMLLVEKDEKVDIFTSSGKFGREYTLNGSAGSELLKELDLRKQAALQKLDSLGQLWIKERYSVDNVAQKEIFDHIADSIINSHKAYLNAFIERYPESPATIIAAYQVLVQGQPLFSYEHDYSLFHSVAESLFKIFPYNMHVKDFRRRTLEYIQDLEAFQAREEALLPGLPAPDFHLFNVQGERVSLSSQTGKYVLIYFWDARKQESWEYNRKLAGLYNLYRYRGFEILGIYTGDDKQLYYNAIRIDGLPWIHLFGNSVVEKSFNVVKTPSMLLVDKEGKILDRSITLEQLANKLAWTLPGTKANKADSARSHTN